MVTGFAFYGLSPVDPAPSVEAASALASTLSLREGEISQYVRSSPDDQGESLHLVDADWDVVASDPKSPNIRFSAVASAGQTELVGGFDDGSNVGFSLVDLSVSRADALPDQDVINVFRIIDAAFTPAYGFAFTTDRPEQVMSYANMNGATLFAGNEDPFSFTDDLSEWSGGKDTFKRSRLRMVYPYNLLNQSHLAISIDDQPLGDWIQGRDDRGRLVDWSSRAAIWIVPAKALVQVNRRLGEAGLLISWRPNRSTGQPRKLP